MQVFATRIPGLVRIQPFRQHDARGRFVKVFHAADFAAAGLRHDWRESYYSSSGPNVLRGMHLQRPPHDHAKLVTCVEGHVLDVVVDLRAGSGFGRFEAVELDGTGGELLYVPEGCAHGFCVLGHAPATLLYSTTLEHVPASDTGIRWDSFGFDWPLPAPLLSPRDMALPALAAFQPLALPGGS